MAEGIGSGVTALARADYSIEELAASKRELVHAITQQIVFNIKQMNLSKEEAVGRARACLRDEPEAREADQVSWLELANLIEHDAERGQAAWQHLKNEAVQELVTGFRVARSLEPSVTSRPYERAQFKVMLDQLRSSLAPRDGLEELLIQQMASVLELNLRWQRLVVQRMETEAWQGERDKRQMLNSMTPAQRERYQKAEGWVPARMTDAESLEQAVMMADRYQRAFLRLMKAFRDNRRLFRALVVAGGQVNIGERQINVKQAQPQRTARTRTTPDRSTHSKRVRTASPKAQSRRR